MSSTTTSVSRANRQIARAAGTVMITFALGKIIGLASYWLLSRTFGAGSDMAAYLAANRFSEILFNLVAGGALGSAFIPVFTTLLTQEQRPAAWRLASAIANLVLLTLIVLGVVSAIFAPWVVTTILAPGFEDPAQQALTVALLRIQLPSAVIFGLSGLVMGILNAHQRFLLPALTPSMYPLGVIFGTAVLAPRLGIYGVAYGVLIGAGLHLLVQVPGLARLPQRAYHFGLSLKLPEVREVLLLMAPRMFGVAIVQMNFWINTLVASHQAESIPAITYAFVIMMMPQAAIAQAIAIASLPTFSAQVALGLREEMRSSLATTLRAVLLLSIPATVGLMVLGTPIVALMYQGGKFDAQATSMVAWALMWYAAGLVGHCLVEIISRAFYALHDTRTPVTVTVVAMLVNVVLSLVLWNVFAANGLMPHGGLALANSLATGMEAVVLLMLMRRRLSGLGGNTLGDALRKSIPAALMMGAAVWAWVGWSAGAAAWLQTLVGVALGGIVYAVVLLVMRLEEARYVVRMGLHLARRYNR